MTSTTMKSNQSIAAGYMQGFMIALMYQAIFLLLGSIALDSGEQLRWVILSIIAYWILALIIVIRRPQSPTRFDLAAIRSGFIVIFFLVIFFTGVIWLLNEHFQFWP